MKSIGLYQVFYPLFQPTDIDGVHWTIDQRQALVEAISENLKVMFDLKR